MRPVVRTEVAPSSGQVHIALGGTASGAIA